MAPLPKRRRGSSRKDLRLPEETRGLLRWRGIDVAPARPLEPGLLGQHRLHVEMPVIEVVFWGPQRHRVQEEVEGRLLQGHVDLSQDGPERVADRAQLLSN